MTDEYKPFDDDRNREYLRQNIEYKAAENEGMMWCAIIIIGLGWILYQLLKVTT